MKTKEEGEFILFGYCLMNNHVHLLIKEDKDPIGRTMKRICVSYSYYLIVNIKESDTYFKIDTRAKKLKQMLYIHNNPVKAGMVRNPEDYQWSQVFLYVSYQEL